MIYCFFLLKEFHNRFPGVSIRIQEGSNRNIAKWLREKSVDCCLCSRPASVEHDWISIYQDELVAWIPVDHPLADSAAFPIENLEKEDFIHTTPGQDTTQDRLLKKLHLHPRTIFTTRDGFTTYNMVGAGLGISFNQRLLSQKWNLSNVIEKPFSPPQFEELGIAVPSLKESSPAAKKLIEFAVQHIRSVCTPALS